MLDQPALEGRIEIAHRLPVKINDTTGFERPDIIYFAITLLSSFSTTAYHAFVPPWAPPNLPRKLI